MRRVVVLSLIILTSCLGNNGVDPTEVYKIGIQPFSGVSDEDIDAVEQAIASMFDRDVVVLPELDIPERAYTTIRYPRYRADTLLVCLSELRPDSIDIMLGLTNKDISITKYKPGSNRTEIKDPEWKYKDFGIFGLGQVGGRVCVVSTNRLHKGVSDNVFFKRLTRISCHEIGHVLGLHHCPEQKCLMNDANESIKTIDKSTGELCGKCQSEILD